MPVTSGSALVELDATDAVFVSRMRGAGAIVIGKTTVPEFGLAMLDAIT
jgi:Asp-tRNA(Asn)/Glu-tRNA(Gln) amidotransferase A subunit family amidase